jgi:hypothetical protein
VVPRIVGEAVQGGSFCEDQWIQVAGHDDAVPPEVGTEEFRGRRLHRTQTCAAAEHQRAIDVEEHERLRKRT